MYVSLDVFVCLFLNDFNIQASDICLGYVVVVAAVVIFLGNRY